MLTIRDIDINDDNRHCGECNTKAVAVLEASNVKIMLCDNCLTDLLDGGTKLAESLKTRCRHCIHFEEPYSYDYCGKCKLDNHDKGWLDTCGYFAAKNV